MRVPDWLDDTRTSYDAVAVSYADLLRDALAGGGTHTRDNVRITHWFCNLKKNTYSDELPEYAKATLARRLYGTPIPEALIRARQAHHRGRRERMLADPDLDPRRRELLERMQVAFGRRSRLKEN
ncbi:hypothetical protein [Acrocarpospora sp. B8E8]|uniref:hypothetical protein n=1 Tax=Acrocarpospora sp. B8E8 TaxID=3153572 RepID=UPI00325E0A7B